MARPNILLFFTDDHAQWALGAYGNREIHAPTLDYLAQTGVRMANAFTPTPVCSPARACLLTGRLASQHGLHDYLAATDPEVDGVDWLGKELTLGQLLHEAGYQTGYCGKWHLGRDEHPQPGFESWFTLGRGYPILHQGPHEYGENGRHVRIPGRPTQVITDRAVDFLRGVSGERPFFLTVGYYATHSPWRDHPPRLVSQYADAAFADIPTDEMYPFGRQNLESTDPTREDPRAALAQYYAAVSEIDEGVGRIVDELAGLGLLANTVIIYTSDHGLNCGHHGIWGKGNGTLPLNMVEESIRVPLLLWHAEICGRQIRTEFVDHLDLFQTILEAAAVPLPAGRKYPGRSFWPLTQNQHLPGWRQAQYCEYGPVRMIRTRRYKLVDRHTAGPQELFDLQTDPREQFNVAEDPQYQQLRTELTAQLTAYFDHYADPQKSGHNGSQLPRCNNTEAWRTRE
jgi:choline-sulfatase